MILKDLKMRYTDKRSHFHTGLGIYNSKFYANAGILFRTGVCLGITDYHFTIGKRYTEPQTDTLKSCKFVPTFNFKDKRDLLDHLPINTQIIGVELPNSNYHFKRAKKLHEFEWPDRCVILLGAEDMGLNDDYLDSCHDIVYVPTDINVSMNQASCGSIVLYSRYLSLMNKGFIS